MDYLDTSKAGGYPFYVDKQIAFLQDVWRNHINALTRRIPDYANKVAILQGCEKSDAGGGLFNVAAGVLFFKGEIVFCDAHQVSQTGTRVWYIEEAADATLDPKTMTDGSQANVHKRRRAKISVSTPAGYVLETAVLDLRTTAWVDVDSEYSANYQANTGANATLKYRIANGYLELRGECEKVVSGASELTICTLPEGYRPNDKYPIPVTVYDSSVPDYVARVITVDSSGVVTGFDIPGNATDEGYVYVNAQLPLF